MRNTVRSWYPVSASPQICKGTHLSCSGTQGCPMAQTANSRISRNKTPRGAMSSIRDGKLHSVELNLTIQKLEPEHRAGQLTPVG